MSVAEINRARAAGALTGRRRAGMTRARAASGGAIPSRGLDARRRLRRRPSAGDAARSSGSRRSRPPCRTSSSASSTSTTPSSPSAASRATRWSAATRSSCSRRKTSAANRERRKVLQATGGRADAPALSEGRLVDAAGRERWYRAARRVLVGERRPAALLRGAAGHDRRARGARARRPLGARARRLVRPQPGRHGAVRRQRPARAHQPRLRASWPAACRCSLPKRRPGPRASCSPGARAGRCSRCGRARGRRVARLGRCRRARRCAGCARSSRCYKSASGERRYMAVVEDRSVEEERDLARIADRRDDGHRRRRRRDLRGIVGLGAAAAAGRAPARPSTTRCRASAATSSRRNRCPNTSGCSTRCKRTRARRGALSRQPPGAGPALAADAGRAGDAGLGQAHDVGGDARHHRAAASASGAASSCCAR